MLHTVQLNWTCRCLHVQTVYRFDSGQTESNYCASLAHSSASNPIQGPRSSTSSSVCSNSNIARSWSQAEETVWSQVLSRAPEIRRFLPFSRRQTRLVLSCAIYPCIRPTPRSTSIFASRRRRRHRLQNDGCAPAARGDACKKFLQPVSPPFSRPRKVRHQPAPSLQTVRSLHIVSRALKVELTKSNSLPLPSPRFQPPATATNLTKLSNCPKRCLPRGPGPSCRPSAFATLSLSCFTIVLPAG